MICPCAPMLNRPARKASATPSPAQISGVATVRVSVIGYSCAARPAPAQLKIDPWTSAA